MTQTNAPPSQREKRPRVVIAEDYVLIQETIKKIVAADCDVVAAVEDGPSAVDAVVTHEPDILLLDVSLPDMNGFAVAQALDGFKVAVKVIFVTAHTDKDYIQRAFELGAQGYVVKGRIWTELLVAVREVATGNSYRSPLIQ